MTNERDHRRTTATPSNERLDDDLVAGKTSRSSLLRAPTSPSLSGIVQRKGGTDDTAERTRALAASGITGSGTSMPFLDLIQQAFGSHDVSGIRAHLDDNARRANADMGSEAYATGEDVSFAGTPDLHTAAHEAAHVVQQRRGVQLSGGVGSVGDAYEAHADAVAARVVRGEFAGDLLDQFAGGGGQGVQHSKVKVSASGSAAEGLTLSIGSDVSGSFKYVTVSDPKLSVTAMPTASKEVEVRKEGTEASASVKAESGVEVETEKGAGAKSADVTPELELKLKRKWGSTVFTDGDITAGTSGGGLSLTAGGEWKNAVAQVKFAVFQIGAKEGASPDDDWDIKLLTATPSITARDVIAVDGVNFACSATLSFNVKLNAVAVGKKLLELGIIKSLKGVGELLGEIGAVPFLFVEGGVETLKAAGKNIIAGKEMAQFIDQANLYSLEVGQNFVGGVLGGGAGQGATSGQQWFNAAFQVAKADHPELTQAEFRAALAGAPGWQESAKIAIARQIRSVLYAAFVSEKKDDIHEKDMAHVKASLFGEGEGSEPPDPKGGLGVPMPEIVDKEAKAAEQTKEVSEAAGKKFTEKLPANAFSIAKQRVANGEQSGTFWTEGVDYTFNYDSASKALEISGGGNFEMTRYEP
jgi:hypothetical protein